MVMQKIHFLKFTQISYFILLLAAFTNKNSIFISKVQTKYRNKKLNERHFMDTFVIFLSSSSDKILKFCTSEFRKL